MKNKVLYVAYCGRSSVSGRLLFEYLKSSELAGDFDTRRTNKLNPKKKADVVIRYGSSKDVDINEDGIEINSADAVNRAADKLNMANILSSTDGVNFPEMFVFKHSIPQNARQLFVRGIDQSVRYVDLDQGDSIEDSFLYCLSPIDKINEYRVHMFNGKCIGIYEKIPINPSDKLRKQYNCSFKRLDRSLEEVKESMIGCVPMAKAASDAIGLVYSGVDVMRDSDGIWWVNEVNSAPGLNSLNVQRVGSLVIDYIVNNGHGVSV